MAPEHLDRFLDSALLERKLGESGDRSIAFVVQREGLAAECGSSGEVLLPLVECESFVHEWEGVRDDFSDGRALVNGVKRKESRGVEDGRYGLLLFLDLNCSFELLNRVRESLLIQEEFAATQVPHGQYVPG